MRKVISASRRTDLPAFHSEWLIESFQKGFCDVKNPHSGVVHRVDLAVEKVHSIVLWSKNFTPLVPKLDELNEYSLFFMYTVNDCGFLEPGVPPLEGRLEQLKFLVKRYGPERVLVRFDPIVFWKEGEVLYDNLNSFASIAGAVSALGIKKITVSFMTVYRKLKGTGISFYDPPVALKRRVIEDLAGIASKHKMILELCCNPYMFEGGWSCENVMPSRCIDGRYITEVTGERASFAKDTGQRKECLCTKSRDIGSYDMGCGHRCLYCYGAGNAG